MRWLALLFALIVGIALSQNPVPSETKEAAPLQQKAKNTKKPAAKDQRGTEIQPLFIKIVDAPKADAKPPEYEDKGGNKPPFIWGMTAEEATSIFTLALVIVAALTALVLICQSYLLRRSVNLAREEFISVNRPVLTVRREQVRWDEKGINFVLANTGKLLATDIIGSISVKVIPASKIADFEKESLPQYENVWIQIGEQLAKAAHKTTNLNGSERAFMFWPSGEINESSKTLIQDGRSVLYFYGLINCKDPGGTIRETAFFRTYNPLTESFKAKDDPDYERTI